MLYESFWSALGRDIWTPVAALRGWRRGRARLKSELASRAKVDPATLPYNPEVLGLIADWRARGARVALVTATDQRLADKIAVHLGVFDEVQGSDGDHNLKGPHKADYLVERFGDGQFDYVGDSNADCEVWRHARRAITVNAAPALRALVDRIAAKTEHLDTQDSQIGAYIRCLRPHQWIKNVLIFIPMLAAHRLDVATLGLVSMAFVAFCLVASSVYVFNDLLDLASDRTHPRKRFRPLASGAVPIGHGTLLAPALLAAGMLSAALTGSLPFFGVIVLYFFLTSAYTLHLKRKLALDICTLAGLYTMRVLAGAYVAALPLSIWLIAFSMFFFFSLAAVKRQAELVDRKASGASDVAGRAYQTDDLPITAMMALSAGYVAVLVMALYIYEPYVSELYASSEALWVVCPILLYWISRMVMLAHRGLMHDDPIVFAATDKTSVICALLIATAIGIATLAG